METDAPTDEPTETPEETSGSVFYNFLSQAFFFFSFPCFFYFYYYSAYDDVGANR